MAYPKRPHSYAASIYARAFIFRGRVVHAPARTKDVLLCASAA